MVGRRAREKLERCSFEQILDLRQIIVGVFAVIISVLLGSVIGKTLEESEFSSTTICILMIALLVIIFVAHRYRKYAESGIRRLLEEVRALATQTALLTEENLYSEYWKKTKEATKRAYILGSGKFYIEKLKKKKENILRN